MLTERLEGLALRETLKQGGLPFPRARERARWQAVAEDARKELLCAAHEQAKQPYPIMTATDFLAFLRTGSRQTQQKPFFARRHKLILETLGECVEHEGAFMDDIINGLWLICEESFWGVNAHNGSSHPGARPAAEHPLPDVDNPYIDLFAAQTGASLSLCCYLLESELDDVTHQLIRRVETEVRRRILAPFMQRDDFWWMGMTQKHLNNWTPWILSNVLACALVFERDAFAMEALIRRCFVMLDRYLEGIAEDGGCEEGAGYWNMAGGSLLDCLEHVREATGGAVNCYDLPKLRALGRFPLRLHIDGGYYYNFADCDAQPTLDGERLIRYGVRVRDDALIALGQEELARHPSHVPSDQYELYRMLCRLFLPVPEARPPLPPAAQDHIASLSLWLCRRGRLYAAARGGNNDESHNHNDLGGFVLYCDGKPILADAGNITYTADTFSPRRYTIWNTRSRNHSVPLIGDTEQAAGARYHAALLSAEQDRALLQLAKAYPERLELVDCTREIALTARQFLVTDDILANAPQTLEEVFITAVEPELMERGKIRLGAIVLEYPPAMTPEITPLPHTDERLLASYPEPLYRLALREGAARQHRCACRFTIESPLAQ